MNNSFVKFLWVFHIRDLFSEKDMGRIPYPSWKQVASAINRLNGDKVHIVTLSQNIVPEDYDYPFCGTSLVIGGGAENGLYICFYYSPDDADPLTLQDPLRTGGIVEINYGCPSDVGSEKGMTKDEVLRAAKAFFETGNMDKTQCWGK